MIDFVCPHCGQTMHVKDEAAGLTGKCKKCGNLVKVPAASTLREPADDFFQPLEQPAAVPTARPANLQGATAGAGRAALPSETIALPHETLALRSGAVGLALLAVSTCLPWVKFGNWTAYGIGASNGQLIFLFSIAAGAAVAGAWRTNKYWPESLLAASAWGTLCFCYFGLSLVRTLNVGGMFGSMVTVGIGLYLAILAALVVAGAFGYVAVPRSKALDPERRKWMLIGSQAGAVVVGLILPLLLTPQVTVQGPTIEITQGVPRLPNGNAMRGPGLLPGDALPNDPENGAANGAGPGGGASPNVASPVVPNGAMPNGAPPIDVAAMAKALQSMQQSFPKLPKGAPPMPKGFPATPGGAPAQAGAQAQTGRNRPGGNHAEAGGTPAVPGELLTMPPGADTNPIAGQVAKQMRAMKEAEVARLEQKKADAESGRGQLTQFQVLQARARLEKHGSRKQWVRELVVKNATSVTVGGASFRGTLQAAGQAAPLLTETFSHKVKGGLAPGEQSEWKITVRRGNSWKNVDENADLTYAVEVVRLDGPNGKPLVKDDFSDNDQQRLDQLKQELAEKK